MKHSFIVVFMLVCISSCTVLPNSEVESTAAALTGEAAQPQTSSAVSASIVLPATALTKEPTITPEPEYELPYQVTDLLDDIQISLIDTFDEVSGKWYQGSGYLDVADGVGSISVTSEGFSFLFPGSFEGDYHRFSEGNGVFFKFKLPDGDLSRSTITFQSGMDGSIEYTERGVAFEYNTLNKSYISSMVGWLGEGDGISNILSSQRLDGNLMVLPDKWYNIMMVINRHGELLLKVWDPEIPEERLIKQTSFGENWQERDYIFSIFTIGSETTMYMDDFVEFDFSPGEVLITAIDYDLPSLVRKSLVGVHVLTLEEFSAPMNWIAASGFFSTKKDGVGKLEIYPASNASSAFLITGPPKHPLQYKEGNAVFLKYMIDRRTDASFTFSSGEWEKPDYREYGLVTGFDEFWVEQVLEANYWIGTEMYPLGDVGDFTLFTTEPGRWYNLLMAVGENGTFTIMVWDPLDETLVRSIFSDMGKDWADRSWQFNISFLTDVPSSAVYIDEYLELTYDGLDVIAILKK